MSGLPAAQEGRKRVSASVCLSDLRERGACGRALVGFLGSLSDQLSPLSSLGSVAASCVCLQPTLFGFCSAAQSDWFARCGLNRPFNDIYPRSDYKSQKMAIDS